uniref:Zinc/iron permease n=1 Tax=Tetranychus urticae TaxID=32264 RepID=T1K0Y8_TETUR
MQASFYTDLSPRLIDSGILVGTALSVIIPIWVNTIYASVYKNHLKASASSTLKEVEDLPHSVIGLSFSASYSTLSTTSDNNLESGGASSSKITATIGLVVHAAAYGVALGGAVTTSHTDVEMIVFFAIMLHKAPAAFGLINFLMHEGVDRKKLRNHLLAFSLAAPVGAFVTYFAKNESAQKTFSDYNATGVAMLFSGGTFLFGATVHVPPEIIHHQALN